MHISMQFTCTYSSENGVPGSQDGAVGLGDV